MADFNRLAATALENIRQRGVLVHSITNYVVMNSTANALLAAGASPVMAHAQEEVEEMAALAAALVLNIGTLEPAWITSMRMAGAVANSENTPVILDPVGAGATRYRTDTARLLAQELNISVVRGNASETLSLGGVDATTRGVDAAHDVEEAARVALELADRLATVVAITGEVDLVTDGRCVLRVEAGHPLMGRVTGTGCTATALTAAFAAVEKDFAAAAAGALAYLGIAGERAAQRAAGPGSFQVALTDSLYDITPEDLTREARIREVQS
jgi:hydroxyethylthiazole kinase